MGTAELLGSLVAVLGTVVGLVVWLTKRNMVRQEKVTDRSFTFMEKQVEVQNGIHTKHAESITTLANAVQKNTETLQEHTTELKQLKQTVRDWNPQRNT